MGHETHRLHIACETKIRSESDLMHRFIAHLKLQNYRIVKVGVSENPLCANVTFRTIESDGRSIISLLKRKRLKSDTQFQLNLSIYKLDQAASNFFIEYSFEDRLMQANNSLRSLTDEDVHAMMETALDGASSFTITRMPDIEP